MWRTNPVHLQGCAIVSNNLGVLNKVIANVSQNSLSESEAVDEVCVFDEQKSSRLLAAEGWVEIQDGANKIRTYYMKAKV